MKVHKSFVLRGNIHSSQSKTTYRCPRFYRIQHKRWTFSVFEG